MSFLRYLDLSKFTDIREIDGNAVKIEPLNGRANPRGNVFQSAPTPLDASLKCEEVDEYGLCGVCRSIRFKTLVYRWHIRSYGTLHQLLARQNCVICRLVLWVLTKDMGFLHPTCLLDEGLNPECTVQEIVPKNSEPCLTIVTGDIVRGFLVPQSSSPSDLFARKTLVSAAITKQGKIDIPKIRSWIDECDQQHQDICELEYLDSESIGHCDLMLIDVDSMKVINASSAFRYLALSYVWGRMPVFKTEKATLATLQQAGGLRLFKDRIPQAIKDAMNLVSLLGERYLWVDSICIVQDDETYKQHQISQMHIVYRRAYLTIIAVAGKSANSRLPGVEPNTRIPPPELEYVQGFHLRPTRKCAQGLLDDSIYESRAWTLHERLVSRRCLFLTPWDCFYQCNSTSCAENEVLFKSSKPNSARSCRPSRIVSNPLFEALSEGTTAKIPSTSWKYGFDIYTHLVAMYTKRQLSDPSDILNAFRSIGTTLEQRFGGRMLNGLPGALLDLAILWSPSSDGSLERRRINHTIQSTKPSFPSWTWAGWKGSVNFLLPGAIMGSTSLRVVLISRITMADTLRIDRRGLRVDQPSLLCIEHPVCPSMFPDDARGTDHDSLCFWAIFSSTKAFSIQGQQRYHLQRPLPATRILNEGGWHCGLLLDYESSISIEKWESSATYEFIMLSSTVLSDLDPALAVSICFQMGMGQPDEEIFDSRHYRSGTKEELINVMLIEWNRSLAERVAIGCMHKDAWGSCQKKYIRLS